MHAKRSCISWCKYQAANQSAESDCGLILVCHWLQKVQTNRAGSFNRKLASSKEIHKNSTVTVW